MADGKSQRLEVGAQVALLVQVPEKRRALDRLGSDEAGVGIVQQVEGIAAEHERGRRLGTENGVAIAGQVGQDAQVAPDRLAGSVHETVRRNLRVLADL